MPNNELTFIEEIEQANRNLSECVKFSEDSKEFTAYLAELKGAEYAEVKGTLKGIKNNSKKLLNLLKAYENEFL